MRKWMNMILREAEGVGSGVAPEAAPAAVAPDAGSILFPSDAPAGEAAASDTAAGDWKEYSPDPAKSEADNALAKAEHDKAKPVDPNDPANKVPDDGKYALTMPDGVELDDELSEALAPEFKELGLTNAQAQKLVDKYIGIQQRRAQGQGDAFAKTVSDWVDAAKKDADMGGDKWDGTVRDAHRAINRLGTPALKNYLNASGGGNHPELIRVLAKAGALISEDNPASGGAGGAGKPAEAAYTLFPSDAPKG